MKIQQVSVFLENRPGRLSKLCQALADGGVNLSTLSMAETEDFGLLRVLTPEPDKAKAAAEGAGFAVKLTEVAALQVPDHPGGLASLLKILDPHGVSVEYMYAFATRKDGEAVMVFRFDDMDKALTVLQAAGVAVFSPVELFG